MAERIKSEPFIVMSVLITLFNVILVWAFRFLPLFDYPIWLYEVRIMHTMSDPMFKDVYELASVPVPNLGFVVPVYLLSFIVSIETAGKIFLTFCVVGLPWSFWYCVRKCSNVPETPIAYFGFPFAFNIFFYGGHAFLLGFIILLLLVGWYFPKLNHITMREWMLLSLLLLVVYFVHAFTFVLTVLVFLAGFVATESRKTTLSAFALSLVPALICLIWYYASIESQLPTELEWSGWALAQNIFKAPFLFIKSYGISKPLPLTLLNILWLIALVFFFVSAILIARTSRVLDKRFLLAIGAAIVLMLALPEILFGVYRPGTRFGLPLIFLALLAVCRARVAQWWRTVALVAAAVVACYNGVHFHAVDRQMDELQTDLQEGITTDASFGVIRFDWPPERDMRDVAAASIDPLFGGMYYHQLDRRGVGWIFGTSMLRLREEYRNLKPVLAGTTPDEHASSFIQSSDSVRPFKYIILVGSNAALWSAAEMLTTRGFGITVLKEHWTILESRHVKE